MTDLTLCPQPTYNSKDPVSIERCNSLESKILTHGVPLSTELCREGNISYVSGDEPIGGALKLFGEWAHSEITILATLIKKGDTLLDVGANIGCHTLSFCNLVGESGFVHAFEPQPLAAELTAYNLFRNGHKNFSVWQIGLGDAAGTFSVPDPARSKILNLGGVSLATKYQDSTDYITVKVYPLDSLPLGKVDFIKCDVEGMEPQVLQGAGSLLTNYHPTLYLECNDLSHGVTIFQRLERLGYTLFLHRAKAFNPDNFKHERGNPFGVSHEINLLAVHSSKQSVLDTVSSLANSATLLKTPTIDDLGKAFFETPRYGDTSDIDRNPQELRESLAATNFGLHAVADKASKTALIANALVSVTELLTQTSVYVAPPLPRDIGSSLKEALAGTHRIAKETILKLHKSPLVSLDYIRSQDEALPTSVEEFATRYAKEKTLWSINTHPLFLALYYQVTHLISTEIPPLIHFVLTDPKKSCHPHPLLRGIDDLTAFLNTPWQDRVEKPALFDPLWYLDKYPDLKASGCDPVLHFAQFGWKEGRDPNSTISGTLLLKTLNDATSPFIYFMLLEKLTTAA